MDNLKMHSYQPAPLAPSSTPAQKGGRGYKHKRGCKCPLCKRRGGGDIEEDIETGSMTKENGYDDKEGMKNDFNFAEENEYNDLDDAEKGNAGPLVKVGGSRRRKHSKKSKKGGKSRKTIRSSRKGRKHRRRTHRRR